MNNIEELNIEYLKINARSVANGVAEISSKWAGETILALIAQLEAAQKERDEFRLAFQQNEQAKQELFAQKDLLITANLNISRRAAKAESELSAANEKHGWIKCSDQMPDPNRQRRVCVFTPHHAADLRYRLVPANLFKAVCSSASHWHYVNDPVEWE